MSSLLGDLKQSGSGVIELCHARNSAGEPFHAFIEMDMETYARYQADLAKNTPLNLLSYGTILHTGWGPEPDDAICQQILESHTDTPALMTRIGTNLKAFSAILTRNAKQTKQP